MRPSVPMITFTMTSGCARLRSQEQGAGSQACSCRHPGKLFPCPHPRCIPLLGGGYLRGCKSKLQIQARTSRGSQVTSFQLALQQSSRKRMNLRGLLLYVLHPYLPEGSHCMSICPRYFLILPVLSMLPTTRFHATSNMHEMRL